jgi:hypothetical protein
VIQAGGRTRRPRTAPSAAERLEHVDELGSRARRRRRGVPRRVFVTYRSAEAAAAALVPADD